MTAYQMAARVIVGISVFCSLVVSLGWGAYRAAAGRHPTTEALLFWWFSIAGMLEFFILFIVPKII